MTLLFTRAIGLCDCIVSTLSAHTHGSCVLAALGHMLRAFVYVSWASWVLAPHWRLLRCTKGCLSMNHFGLYVLLLSHSCAPFPHVPCKCFYLGDVLYFHSGNFTHTLALAHAQTSLLFIRTYLLGMLVATLLGTHAITPFAFLFPLLWSWCRLAV